MTRPTDSFQILNWLPAFYLILAQSILYFSARTYLFIWNIVIWVRGHMIHPKLVYTVEDKHLSRKELGGRILFYHQAI